MRKEDGEGEEEDENRMGGRELVLTLVPISIFLCTTRTGRPRLIAAKPFFLAKDGIPRHRRGGEAR